MLLTDEAYLSLLDVPVTRHFRMINCNITHAISSSLHVHDEDLPRIITP